VVNRQLKVQRLQANGISQRRLSRLCHLLNTQQQQERNEQERRQASSSLNNLPELLRKQRGIDNGKPSDPIPFDSQVKKGEKIPAGKLAAAAKKPGKLGQRARLAQTLKKMK